MATVQETTCCGLGEIYDVGSSSVEDILRAAQSAKRRRMGMIFATTTQCQTGAPKKMRKAGFKIVRRFKNPNSGNTIQLWMLPTSSLKEPPKPKKPAKSGTYAYQVAGETDYGYWEWRAPHGESFISSYSRNGVPISGGEWVWYNYND